MTFRPATIEDAALLYAWRVEAEHADWYQGAATTFDEHLVWLGQRLSNPLVKMLVWEQAGDPCGTVRIDSNGEVAFHADTDEDAVEMLRAARVFAAEYGGRLKATVDVSDERWNVFAWAGFERYPATFLAYKPKEKP